jgi:hypothetical protein
MGEPENCPYNTFVSGITEKAEIRPRSSLALASTIVFPGLLKLTSLSSFDYYSIQLGAFLVLNHHTAQQRLDSNR